MLHSRGIYVLHLFQIIGRLTFPTPSLDACFIQKNYINLVEFKLYKIWRFAQFFLEQDKSLNLGTKKSQTTTYNLERRSISQLIREYHAPH
jgi:hypothetical protein